MVLMMAVVVSSGDRGRDGRTVVTRVTARHGSRRGRRGRQVVAHGRVVRPCGGHGRGGSEPVRGVRHLAAGGQVAVSHGRVVHVRSRSGAGQPVEVGLVQVRVVHAHAVARRVYGRRDVRYGGEDPAPLSHRTRAVRTPVRVPLEVAARTTAAAYRNLAGTLTACARRYNQIISNSLAPSAAILLNYDRHARDWSFEENDFGPRRRMAIL